MELENVMALLEAEVCLSRRFTPSFLLLGRRTPSFLVSNNPLGLLTDFLFVLHRREFQYQNRLYTLTAKNSPILKRLCRNMGFLMMRCFYFVGKWLVLMEGKVSLHVRKDGRLLISFGVRTMEQDAEMMRLQLLGDPTLMSQMQRARIQNRTTPLPHRY